MSLRYLTGLRPTDPGRSSRPARRSFKYAVGQDRTAGRRYDYAALWRGNSRSLMLFLNVKAFPVTICNHICRPIKRMPGPNPRQRMNEVGLHGLAGSGDPAGKGVRQHGRHLAADADAAGSLGNRHKSGSITVWPLVAGARTICCFWSRNRKFVDSPLEGNGFELLVPRHKSRGFPQHSGHGGGSTGLLSGTA